MTNRKIEKSEHVSVKIYLIMSGKSFFKIAHFEVIIANIEVIYSNTRSFIKNSILAECTDSFAAQENCS